MGFQWDLNGIPMEFQWGAVGGWVDGGCVGGWVCVWVEVVVGGGGWVSGWRWGWKGVESCHRNSPREGVMWIESWLRAVILVRKCFLFCFPHATQNTKACVQQTASLCPTYQTYCMRFPLLHILYAFPLCPQKQASPCLAYGTRCESLFAKMRWQETISRGIENDLAGSLCLGE